MLPNKASTLSGACDGLLNIEYSIYGNRIRARVQQMVQKKKLKYLKQFVYLLSESNPCLRLSRPLHSLLSFLVLIFGLTSCFLLASRALKELLPLLVG